MSRSFDQGNKMIPAIYISELEKAFKNLKVLRNGIQVVCRNLRMAAIDRVIAAVYARNDLDGCYLRSVSQKR